ncbi:MULTISPECIES: TIGR02922 family protein [Shewanella]|uniref:TIGR02922 family protein n=1 Tax=Shewanella salipaludis TaxID=2723052 RepID=A0A972G003_9GAMM|nr:MULTISPECIES: TIGR02922 family protein [Shewanella]MCE9686598.1 TIGR02922 family protein [Shewanella sp. AS16]NMH65822.1 TIGR02922 family protein [Shewanella salipaludis]
MQDKQTVTVLYYDFPAGLVMHNVVLKDLPVSEQGRVLIPAAFREGKSIVAIMEGECKMLNSLGERVFAKSDIA